ncbi:MAG: acylphosphatase [Bacteroidales bacterium]|nr:acylphosphatase [Bacteroidales bacterium]
MKKHAVIIKVSGRVQGVGFRYYTVEKARELSVTGYVQNSNDGSVLIEAEAENEPLNEFVQWCRKGPAWARVTDIKISDTLPLGYTSFEIK